MGTVYPFKNGCLNFNPKSLSINFHFFVRGYFMNKKEEPNSWTNSPILVLLWHWPGPPKVGLQCVRWLNWFKPLRGLRVMWWWQEARPRASPGVQPHGVCLWGHRCASGNPIKCLGLTPQAIQPKKPTETKSKIFDKKLYPKYSVVRTIRSNPYIWNNNFCLSPVCSGTNFLRILRNFISYSFWAFSPLHSVYFIIIYAFSMRCSSPCICLIASFTFRIIQFSTYFSIRTALLISLHDFLCICFFPSILTDNFSVAIVRSSFRYLHTVISPPLCSFSWGWKQKNVFFVLPFLTNSAFSGFDIFAVMFHSLLTPRVALISSHILEATIVSVCRCCPGLRPLIIPIGSGKTYTMMGSDHSQPGINVRFPLLMASHYCLC